MTNCPDCNKPLQALPKRAGAWCCTSCGDVWHKVCDHCLQRSCFDGVLLCEKARTAGITDAKRAKP